MLFNISATAEASNFKFGIQRVFAKTHHKITPREISGGGVGLGEFPNILEFPYNISATAGASNFKFDAQLGFAKAHHKITHRRKVGRGPGQGELPKIWDFPFNIYTMAKASDFKFSRQLGFAKAHYKSTLRGKWAWPLVREAPIYLGLPFNISTTVKNATRSFLHIKEIFH